MKITFNRLFFYVFALLWVGLIIINLLTSEKTFSENENRTLKSMPEYSYETLINGEYMSNIDEYFNDQFIGRDLWINAQSIMEYSIGKRENNNVFIAKNGALMDNIAEPNAKYVDANIRGINYFSSQYDIACSIMIIPSASFIQSDMLPYTAQVWDQKEFIEDIYEKIENVIPINLCDTLFDHKNEYIYYRTDHHWTTYGAFLAYEKYCEAMNLPIRGEFKFETVSNHFNGTLYSRSGIRFIKSDIMDSYKTDMVEGFHVYTGTENREYESIYFEEFLDKKDKYSYFLGTSQPIVTMKGSCKTDKKLLIFKDSYSHCFAPMLLEQYSEITLVDLRYVNQKLNDIIDLKKYDNALFLFSVDVFANQNNLIKLKMFS